MNNFTKNELEQLADILDICVDEKDIKLLHKIDALIKNYCEHEKTYTKLDVTVCIGCGRVIEEKMISITSKEYQNLLDAESELACLYEAGVDNWSGYSDAMEIYND